MSYKSSVLDRKRIITGFTVIELLLMISVTVLLASTIVLGYSSWRQTAAKTQVKNDLGGVVSTMRNSRNFSNSYAEDVADLKTLKSSDGVVLSGGSLDGGKTFCVDASYSQFPSIQYHVDSENGTDAQSGACPATQSANLRVRINGPGTGKVVVTDGAYKKECLKTVATDTTKYCDYTYKYIGGSGKIITSIVAVPDDSGDIPGLKWWDYWQCMINSGATLSPGSIIQFTDSTFRVNFGSHTYSCGTAIP